MELGASTTTAICGDAAILTMTICSVNVCEQILEDIDIVELTRYGNAGVCEKCEINDLNNGDYLRCENEECDNFLCDHCGTNTSTYILGGDASVFLCCDDCFDEVSKKHASELDYTSERKHDLCNQCR